MMNHWDAYDDYLDAALKDGERHIQGRHGYRVAVPFRPGEQDAMPKEHDAERDD